MITDTVLAETVWTLKGKKYKVDRNGISEVLNALFAEPAICFEDDQVVWKALNDYISADSHGTGRKSRHVDFSDTLIINKARHLAMVSGQSFEGFYTFDIAAQAVNGASKL